jgi:hypothetical protein
MIVCGTACQCIDAMTDPMNCGGCNVKCNPAQICVQGACI